MKSYIKYNWPSVCWAAFIMVICMMPAHHIPRVRIPHFDKVVHTGIYTFLALLTYFGWIMQNSFTGLHRHSLIKIILLLSAYGLTIEIMQETLTTDRHFEWLDELANASGSVIGTFAGRFLFRRRQAGL